MLCKFINGARSVQPLDVAKSPEPFHLPPRELARGDLDLFDGIVQRFSAMDMFDQFVIPRRFGGGFGKLAVSVEQGARLRTDFVPTRLAFAKIPAWSSAIYSPAGV